MGTRHLLLLVPTALGLVAPVFLGNHADAAPPRGGVPARVVLLDAAASGSRLFMVPVEGVPYLVELEPHSVRAAGYRILTQAADGSLRAAEPGPVRTLRGSVVGLPGSVVAASLVGGRLHARLEMGDGARYWVEPIGDRVPGADPDDHFIYRDSEVPPTDGVCVVTADSDAPKTLVPPAQPVPAGGDDESCVAELAVDADYEYYVNYGSDVQAVEDRVNAVINALNIQYERDVGITHLLTTIIVRTAEPDPYDEIFAGLLKLQMQEHWNAHHQDVERDLAQLFTGRDLYGTQLGYSAVGQVCNSSLAYSIVQSDWSGSFAEVTDLHAHELGHNWNAVHCDCSGWTMYGYPMGGNQFHPDMTVSTIAAFRDSLDCLECGGPKNPEVETPATLSEVADTASW